MQRCVSYLHRYSSHRAGFLFVRRAAIYRPQYFFCTVGGFCPPAGSVMKLTKASRKYAVAFVVFITCLAAHSFSAEREGFEPPVQLPVHRISSAARSTTPASFRDTAGARPRFAATKVIIICEFTTRRKNLLPSGRILSFGCRADRGGECPVQDGRQRPALRFKVYLRILQRIIRIAR